MKGEEKVLRMNGDEFGRVTDVQGLGRWLDELSVVSGSRRSRVSINKCRSPILNGGSYEVVARGSFKISPMEDSVRIVRREPAVVVRVESGLVLVPAGMTHLVS